MTDHVAYPGCYYTDCVEGTPSARITGDKDRENPVEGAPYGEGLIGRIDALEAKNELLRRALSYAQDKQISLMLQRRDLEAENARLRDALTSEREENLWNAYGTGIVRDGKWDHLCMSGGEWLADQCGFDRKTRRYSDQAIRDAIPIAARQALAKLEKRNADQ